MPSVRRAVFDEHVLDGCVIERGANGFSFISDPYGRVLAQAPRDRPAVLVADLDLDQRADWLTFGPHSTRRPDTYASLVGEPTLEIRLS